MIAFPSTLKFMKFICKMKVKVILLVSKKIVKYKMRKFNNHLQMYNLNHANYIPVMDTMKKQVSKPSNLKYKSYLRSKKGADTENGKVVRVSLSEKVIF